MKSLKRSTNEDDKGSKKDTGWHSGMPVGLALALNLIAAANLANAGRLFAIEAQKNKESGTDGRNI